MGILCTLILTTFFFRPRNYWLKMVTTILSIVLFVGLVTGKAIDADADMKQISFEEWQSREADWISEDWIIIEHRLGEDPGPFESNTWDGYSSGFGEESGDNYWMGLEKLHEMTSTGDWDVYFSLRESFGGATFICHNFRVASELHYYKVNLNSCGDLVTTNYERYKDYPEGYNLLDNIFFTTTDKDLDSDAQNCATQYHGGFWYPNIKYICMFSVPPTGNSWEESKMAIRKTNEPI